MTLDEPPAGLTEAQSAESAAKTPLRVFGNLKNPAQFEAIFLEHWPRIYAVLLRLVGDHAEAEDLALETFLKMYRSFPAKDPQFNTGGWLYRVATNLGLNAIRDWKRRQRYEKESGRTVWLENQADEPAELFAGEEQRQMARKVLGEMSPRQAQLLILRYEGKSYKEIAAALGLAVSSIGPLLLRAEVEFEKRFRAADQGG